MYKLLGLSVLLTASAFGAGFGFCECPPSIAVFVNGTNYSDNFNTTTDDGGQTYHITGAVINDTFQFFLNATTMQDTSIDFDTSISGDPTVAFIITQSFLASALLQLDTASSGVIQDLSGDGHASALGSPFLQTTRLNGNIVDQINNGCDVTGTSGFRALCPPLARNSSFVELPPPDPFFPSFNTLELRVGFSLSDNDRLDLTGSTTLNIAPEPSTIIPMFAGLLAMAGIAWRKRSLA